MFGDLDDSSGSGSGDSRPQFWRTPQQQSDYERQIMKVHTMYKLITLEGLNRTEFQIRRPRDLRKMFGQLEVAAVPLTNSPENIRGFHSIQLDPNEPGAAELVSKIDTYVLQYVGVADLSYFESYPPIFSAPR